MQDVVAKYEEHDASLETVWLDGNYMNGFADFTVNETAFGGLKEYTNNLHDWGKKVVLMLYGGLADDVPSKYVTAADGALIMDGAYPYDAQTFSNSTKFLDFFAK